jgi:methyl-accepting chemotaxis protein
MAQGDYRSAVAVDRSDEIGQVMQSLAAMRAQVWGLVDPIAAGSQQVAAASCQLSAVASEVESSSRQQSEAAGSMAAAMEQLTVSIDQVSENAREAHRVSNESGVLSADGMQLIQLTAATISRVESDVKTVASTVLDLGQRADAISSIVNTIKEIADQTNLLALNASIEAARAGEQGRGFAVVADEVRKLAERTTASTQEIAGVIQQIQGGTRSVVDQIGSSVQIASEGAQLAARAEDSMLQIKAGSDRVVAAVTDISSALSEQTTASSDIARNVEKIANMAERNEAAVSHVAQAARDLQQLSQHLQQSVSKISI